ncbi:MAG: glycoside hydrolase family 5 protein [Fibrobacter sp.]|nr:glycoside hydrolase family 5 protein [Fibrobacter sp.]
MSYNLSAKIFSLILLLIVCTFAGKLRVSKDKIINDKEETVVLQGVNMSGLEWHFKPWFGSVTINHVATQWKGNVIRFPLNAQWYINNENSQEKPYRTSVKEVVDFCARYGMWAILDLHWQNETVQQKTIDDAVAKNFWKLIATDFKDAENVLYDLYNEPINIDWNGWKARAESYINVIKQIDPSAIYIVGGTDWGYDLSQAASNPISSSVSTNVIYSSHHYPWKSTSFPAPVYSNLVNKVPLILGEFGWCVNNCKPCESNGGSSNFVTQLLAFVKAHPINVSYAAWNFDQSGCPLLLDTNRTPFTRNAFGNLVYSDLRSKNLIRFEKGNTIAKNRKVTMVPAGVYNFEKKRPVSVSIYQKVKVTGHLHYIQFPDV